MELPALKQLPGQMLPPGVADILGLQKQCYTGRMDQDNMPFSGDEPAMLKEGEYERRTQVVHDVRADLFDLRNEKHKKTYETVLSYAYKRWLQISTREIHLKEDENEKPYVLVYIEYNVPTRQLGPDEPQAALPV